MLICTKTVSVEVQDQFNELLISGRKKNKDKK